ncbi:TPA: transposase [Enterobacter bugandensis]
MEITLNSVWKTNDTDVLKTGLYRILGIYSDTDTIILFELQDNRANKPFFFSLRRFILLVKTRIVIRTTYALPLYMLVDEDSLDQKSKNKRDENYNLILPIIQDGNFLYDFTSSLRSPILTRHASDAGVNPQHLRLLLARYWRYGQNIYALLPAYSRSGAPGKERNPDTIPLGKKKKNRVLPMQRASTYILKSEDKKNIIRTIKKYYLKVGGFSLARTYEEYLKDFFRDEIEVSRAANKAPCIPSLRQFRYWGKKRIPQEKRIRARSTKSNFMLNKRARLGSAANTSTLPGDVFEIDATVADVHLVSSLNKTNVIGRPTIYTVVDRATRMVTGVHVSLYHASWRAARQALANCFMPKKEFCRLFGINISERDWPCSHVPVKLVCDNGEMIGLKPQDVVTPITTLEFAPGYRADKKSIVERRFGILNREAIHPLLGSTRGGLIVKGEPVPTSRACLTLQEVTKTIILAILEHNQAIFKELAYINPLLIEHDLNISPLNSWLISLKNSRFSARTIMEDEVISRLLPPERVSITPGGLQYNNLYYECEEDLASVARVFGQSSCEARIDDNCVDFIYVRLDKNKPFTRHALLEKRYILKGMPHLDADTLADWVDLRSEKSPVTASSYIVKEFSEALQETGLQRLNTLKPHNSTRTKNITENKREELRKNAALPVEKVHSTHQLPLENITLLPGPKEKEKWLATKNNQNDIKGEKK